MQRFLLLLVFWAFFLDASGQNLNGKWMGYFKPNADLEGKYYAYELTITENAKHELNVLAISKFPNFKLAKAIAKGLHTPATKLVSIEETKFESLQIDPNTQACLMHNFLTYQNNNGHEVLQGTYISSNAINGKDCGGGNLFLEKVPPIVKIKPIQKVEKTDPNKQVATIVTKQVKSTANFKNKVNSTNLIISSSSSSSNNSSSFSSSNIANTSTNTKIELTRNKSTEISVQEEAMPENKIEEAKATDLQVIPWLLISRENKLVKKIITHNKAISIDLYDNGTIDNDTINVFDNKVLLVNKKRLSYKAIHIDLSFNNSVTTHEVIIVAHNMGTVPPNTALLVYKDGDTRQELFITSTNKMNAKLVIEYQPPSP